VNLTDQITKTCVKGPYSSECTFALPGGAVLIQGYTEARNVGIFPVIKYFNKLISVAFANEPDGILIDFYTILNPFHNSDTHVMQASETILQLCVQTINTTVSEGTATSLSTQWYTNFTNMLSYAPSDPRSGQWAMLPDGQKFRMGASASGTLSASLRLLMNGTFARSVTGGGGHYQGSGMQGIVSNIYNPPYDLDAVNLMASNLAMSLTNQ
jgi:hypothetical protein